VIYRERATAGSNPLSGLFPASFAKGRQHEWSDIDVALVGLYTNTNPVWLFSENELPLQ
jgi:hypothetical protein